MTCNPDDRQRDLGAGLTRAVVDALDASPDGIGEHALLSRLREQGFFAFLGESPWHPHALFDAHFLLFHVLYRLRDEARAQRRADLQISPLDIRWLPWRRGERALDAPDSLRDYYLDLSNLKATSPADVDELLASFWRRFAGSEQRAAALAELGLRDPVDDAAIKRAWRELAMRHHPDRGGDTQQLQAINAAVNVLLKSG